MIEGISGLQETFGAIGEDIKTFVIEKPLATIGIGAGALGITALGVGLVTRKKKKKAKKKAKKKTKKGRSKDWRYASKQKHERAYRRRRKKLGKKSYQKKYKKRSKSKKRTGKIYYTKKGQPYIILRSGKAKFIKKTKRRWINGNSNSFRNDLNHSTLYKNC